MIMGIKWDVRLIARLMQVINAKAYQAKSQTAQCVVTVSSKNTNNATTEPIQVANHAKSKLVSNVLDKLPHSVIEKIQFVGME